MTKLSHQLQGGAFSLLLFSLSHDPLSFSFYAGNLLPDVDILWGYGAGSGKWYSHRGATHSLLVVFFLLILGPLLAFEGNKVFLFFSLGYANHVFFDSLSPTGVPIKLSYYPRMRYPLYRNNSLQEALLVFVTSLFSLLVSLYLSRSFFMQLTSVIFSCILYH